MKPVLKEYLENYFELDSLSKDEYEYFFNTKTCEY